MEVDLAESGLWPLKQQVNNLKGFIELSADSPIDPRENQVQSPAHSEDFRCVNWYGKVYSFTPGQAGVVRLLWQAWESGVPSCSSLAITDAAGGDSSRVRDIFKVTGAVMHPAFGTMICKRGRDMYFLHIPDSSENPT